MKKLIYNLTIQQPPTKGEPMKGKINRNGNLWIERPGKPDDFLLCCPFKFTHSYCGDWCPHFREPQAAQNGQVYIALTCGGETLLLFDDFKDERQSKEV